MENMPCQICGKFINSPLQIAADAHKLAHELAPEMIASTEQYTNNLEDFEANDVRNYRMNDSRKMLAAKAEKERQERLLGE